MTLTPLKIKVLTGSLVGSLLLAGGLAIALTLSVSELKRAKEVISDLSRWQDLVSGSISLASGSSKKLSAEAASLQVQALADSNRQLKDALAKSNEAIAALESQTARAKEAQAAEAKARAKAVADAEYLAARLAYEAEHSVPANQVEARIRAIQDQVYEAGL